MALNTVRLASLLKTRANILAEEQERYVFVRLAKRQRNVYSWYVYTQSLWPKIVQTHIFLTHRERKRKFARTVKSKKYMRCPSARYSKATHRFASKWPYFPRNVISNVKIVAILLLATCICAKRGEYSLKSRNETTCVAQYYTFNCNPLYYLVCVCLFRIHRPLPVSLSINDERFLEKKLASWLTPLI